ncbi:MULTISPECIES: hypothetical protein [Methylobacter]|jgi:hypothetical protein|uniref:hypothetical protein n=1 Tax=Methylobacter TaxID=429 RepID=UPI00036FE904|nr:MULTISPECIES: hypothetical protein [Methylobacter]
MSETTKLIIGVVAFFVIGFIMVGTNKSQSPEQMEQSSQIRVYASMQSMANNKCPAAIKQHTGEQVFFPSETKSDKETYITLKWVGENKDGFKAASCTVNVNLGGISELIIDDKVIINKKV